MKVCRRATFNAAHRLFREDWNDQRNKDVFGKCSNPNYHGHNYVLEVWLEGNIDQETGYVIDLKIVKDAIKSEINSSFGASYYQPRKFKNKNENAQEAHEAIRPSYMNESKVDDADTNRLYELIWKRTIASQMSDAQFEKTTAKIEISTNKETLTASGEVMKFDGFLKVYLEGKDDDELEEADENASESEAMLPPLAKGQVLDFTSMTGLERFSRAASRFTEASLVKKLEELGIGRPSTYAPTISTIQKRDYVNKEAREGTPRKYVEMLISGGAFKDSTKTENTGAEKNKLFPTNIAMVVNDFLVEHRLVLKVVLHSS